MPSGERETGNSAVSHRHAGTVADNWDDLDGSFHQTKQGLRDKGAKKAGGGKKISPGQGALGI
ncbi:MAG TPA: hypothetical protein VGL77_11315 [Armatimonadota bacterium]